MRQISMLFVDNKDNVFYIHCTLGSEAQAARGSLGFSVKDHVREIFQSVHLNNLRWALHFHTSFSNLDQISSHGGVGKVELAVFSQYMLIQSGSNFAWLLLCDDVLFWAVPVYYTGLVTFTQFQGCRRDEKMYNILVLNVSRLSVCSSCPCKFFPDQVQTMYDYFQ